MNDAYLDTQVKKKTGSGVSSTFLKILLYSFEWAMEMVSSLLNEIWYLKKKKKKNILK